MTTVLDKALKRQITVGEADYTVVLDPDGLRVVGKGKRRAEVQLRWSDLLSGDAALAVALNASLGNAKTSKGRSGSAAQAAAVAQAPKPGRNGKAPPASAAAAKKAARATL